MSCWKFIKRSVSGCSNDWQLSKSEVMQNEMTLQSMADCLCKVGDLVVVTGKAVESPYVFDGSSTNNCIAITQNNGELPEDPNLIEVYWNNILIKSNCPVGISYEVDYSNMQVKITNDGLPYYGDSEDPCTFQVQFLIQKQIKDVLTCFPQEDEPNNCGC